MAKKILSLKMRRVINSYIIAQEDPLEEIDDLHRYIRKKSISKIKKPALRNLIKNKVKNQEKEDLKKLEAELFTKEGKPKKHRYGSAFCDNCYMYKDYEKECPYCGKIEFTR
ncbi:MAG: hypothetical protein ACLFVB_08800 [Thermoplasmata archaeon]